MSKKGKDLVLENNLNQIESDVFNDNLELEELDIETERDNNFYIKEVDDIEREDCGIITATADRNNVNGGLSAFDKDSDLKRYVRNAFSIPNLTNEEEIELMNKYFEKKNIESGKRIIASHLKLVVKIGFKYRRYTNSFFDLISEGNLGLMHALKKFNPIRGIKFATYATFWIKSYIQDYIIKTWSSIKNRSKDLKKKLFSSAKDRDDIKIDREISLERTLYDDENQVYQIEEDENFVENFLNNDKMKSRQKIIKEAILQLDARAIFIVQERFFKEKKMTLGDLSEKLKISKERTRQIEEKSIDFIKKYIKDNCIDKL